MRELYILSLKSLKGEIEMPILYILFYGTVALLVMTRFESWFDSLPEGISGMVGIAVGTLCAILAIVTDLVISIRSFKN